MFGDIMHGAILTVFGMYLCLGKREKGNLVDLAAPVRYMVLLIGIFSFYCGFVYNDFSSLATAVFPTCYQTYWTSEKVEGSPRMVYATLKDNDCVYPFGIDHTWYRSPLELNVMNGLKMKTSVIYGVAQMLLGTGIKGLNAFYFGRWVELLFVVTAQILLLSALFGFMDYMIIVKWTTDWDKKLAGTGEIAPGIISTMITMMINFGYKPEPTGLNAPQADLIEDQQQWMHFLLAIAGISVPTLLFAEPVLVPLCRRKKKTHSNEYELVKVEHQDDYTQIADLASNPEQSFRQLAADYIKEVHDDHGFSDLFIHSLIECIEYSLGTVSNTASYLRLWALSLAHGQLAKVFMDYTLAPNFQNGGSYSGLFIGYYIFFGVTFAVLMLMDLMEAEIGRAHV